MGIALVGTVRTEKPEDLATADSEIDAIDGDALAAMVGQAVGLDNRSCRHGRNPTVFRPHTRMIWIMGYQIS